ncbi:hypothetical protein PNEG_02717 [Pneumocystis murina B123]|uniref:Uncharacterized protein n=1 Tax=Pneumocystis murina (strain B123) TaxID=1069680 RepID=M7NPB6_PNEMU|nr:hypothetical protein PNEG_02717 [Pneumocystis murina B123]EMR08936.1 hypothetical protein PNEG_02717 [Pneumocystis murina B123]
MTHIPSTTAEYLTQRLNQLACKEVNQETNNCCKEKRRKNSKSCPGISLLSMFLSSPKASLPEISNVDLLSDHESTSGHSTPTPPLMLRLTPKSNVKFVAPPRKSNVHELVHTLSPILQQPYFPHISQAEPIEDKSQYYVRFTAVQKGENMQAQVSKPSKEELMVFSKINSKKILKNGLIKDEKKSIDISNDLRGGSKPSIKILLENVLPRERLSFVGIEDETDEDYEGLEDEEEKEIQEELEDEEEKEIQEEADHLYKSFYGNQNIEKTNLNNIRNHSFEPASYEEMVATSYDSLKKSSVSLIDCVNQSFEYPPASSRSNNFQDDTDFIFGNLDEDQLVSPKEGSDIRRFTKEFKIVTPHDIDPTFPYSDIEESDSADNSFSDVQHTLYHHSPPFRTKKNKKILSIRSLPGQKEGFHEKEYFKKYFKKSKIHTINIPLHKNNHQKHSENNKNKIKYPYRVKEIKKETNIYNPMDSFYISF